MKLLHKNIGNEVVESIGNAEDVTIASAYFHPLENEIELLENVPNLKIFVLEEFRISNPNILERLSKKASVKYISTSPKEGKFHAKVIYCRNRNNYKTVFVGSANFTNSGLFLNHEVVTKVSTNKNKCENNFIIETEKWIESLEALGYKPNWKLAKSIYEEQRTKKVTIKNAKFPDRQHWVLKTHAGHDGKDYWAKFKSESVVAIGWESLTINPSFSSLQEIKNEVNKFYPDKKRATGKIYEFSHDWTKGDLVILCKGYPPNSSSDVFLYGFARIEDTFKFDSSSGWWKFKYPAAIQIVEEFLPKNIFTTSLNRDSLLETLHNLDKKEFNQFCETVEKTIGINVEV